MLSLSFFKDELELGDGNFPNPTSSYISLPPAELTKTASELTKKMEQLNAKRLEQSELIRRERMHIPDGDLFRVNHGNGLFNVALDELQAFITDIKNV
ncbi:hypothetical protein Acr_18g0000520 [Actinidia rufa]|uniref:Uncharacterized protein n=1 Tax=Actinidia rufa TaxID=165716 RepID=A0A7J0G578_9ERIC|nr:hypothetical protein Acr_18g0000520 [Actinidia rufa]